MARTWRGRLSRRDQIQQINDAHRFYGAMSIKPNGPAIAETFCKPLPAKRDKVVRPVDGKPAVPYEKEVLADALQALRNDPRVYICERTQSGVFQDGDRHVRVGVRGKLDITGMLRGGRYFELEAKRPGKAPDPRQAERIERIKRGGGVAGFFTSAEEALKLLP